MKKFIIILGILVFSIICFSSVQGKYTSIQCVDIVNVEIKNLKK